MTLRAFFRETFKQNNQRGCVALILAAILLLILAIVVYYCFFFKLRLSM
jgi:hypothetical protein